MCIVHAHDPHFIGQLSAYKLIVIDCFRSFGFSVFANDASACLRAIFHHRVRHFQTYVHGIMQNDFIIDLFAVDQRHHQNGVCIGSIAAGKGKGQRSIRVQSAPAGYIGGIGYIQNPGRGRVIASQLDLIFDRAGRKLIVLDILRHLAVRLACQGSADHTPLQPGKGHVNIGRFYKHNGNVIENDLRLVIRVRQLYFKGKIIRLPVRPTLCSEYNRTAFRLQCSPFTGIVGVLRICNLSVLGQGADEFRRIGKYIFGQFVAFYCLDRRFIGCADNCSGSILVLLPGELQFQIQGIAAVQHIGKLQRLLDHPALTITRSEKPIHPESIIPLATFRHLNRYRILLGNLRKRVISRFYFHLGNGSVFRFFTDQ